MSADKPFKKENLDSYLKELGKEFRKKNGIRMPAEYLVAMKLMAGRQYKYDLSDIVGVLIEQEEKNEPFDLEKNRNSPGEKILAAVDCQKPQ